MARSDSIAAWHARLRACVIGALVAAGAAPAGCAQPPATQRSPSAPDHNDGPIVSAPDTPRPPFTFSEADEHLLDDVQRGAFNYLWKAASPATGMVYDRSSVRFASIAGVGFQLAAIPVGVERGWISRDEGEDRTLTVLRALSSNPGNRHEGLFYHFLDGQTAGPARGGPETVVSTIDSALLLAGVAVAASYFGGEAEQIGNRLLDGAHWSRFVSGDDVAPHERGFISLGWKPADPDRPAGEGGLLPYSWVDSGDEHRLVCFMANTPAGGSHRVDAKVYYRLRRALGEYGDTGRVVWFPWSGALFTAFFAHCFIDYAHSGPDDPGAFGAEHRVGVDWWENSRRLVRLHQLKCAENPLGLPTLGENAWGLTASDSPGGYAVPGLFPDAVPMPGARPEFDVATVIPKDNFGDGTVAPYGAGCSILFDPARGMAALRHYRGLRDDRGEPLVWRDPAAGGFGFQDAVNLGEPGGRPWVAPDCVAIDQGPLVLCIENARTGLIWRLFHQNDRVRAACDRLGISQNSRR